MMPPAENSTTPSTSDLLRQDKLDLEGYQNLSVWNQQDVLEIQAYDKVFLPLALGAPIYVLVKNAEAEPVRLMHLLPAVVGSIALLSLWYISTFRCNKRIRARACRMDELEFKAHSAIDYDSLKPRDIITRTVFFLIMLAALIILTLIHTYFYFCGN